LAAPTATRPAAVNETSDVRSFASRRRP
jgi:hypothetical protein